MIEECSFCTARWATDNFGAWALTQHLGQGLPWPLGLIECRQRKTVARSPVPANHATDYAHLLRTTLLLQPLFLSLQAHIHLPNMKRLCFMRKPDFTVVSHWQRIILARLYDMRRIVNQFVV